MQYTIHEMLTDVSKGNTKTVKTERLKKYDSPELRALMKSSYDPNIKWLLPEGDVPYTKSESQLGDGHRFLVSEISSLYHFVKGGDNQIKQSKREQMFIQILECLHTSEAEVLISAKDKSLHRKYVISDSVVREAFDWDKNYQRK
jgi:hypothetical protein